MRTGIKKAPVDLKKDKYHIICSWILLTCFAAGQYMIYAHQHNIVNGTAKIISVAKNSSRQTVTEKCQLCDVMHHNVMVKANTIHFNPVTATSHVFKTFNYSFTSIQLILASGRGPPALI